MSSMRLRNMREAFHVELRKKQLEETFRLKRLVTTTVKHYPIEQLIFIVDKLQEGKELNDEEYQIMNSILDDVQHTAINEPSQFFEWAEHLKLIKTLVDSMCLGTNPKYSVIATKAASCFRQVVKSKKPRVYIGEHFDQVYDIYKSWIDSDSSLLKDNGLKGLTQLAEMQSPQLSRYDFVEKIITTLQQNRYNEQALKVLTMITKNIDDDTQVIAILRIASKLIDNYDSNMKLYGLSILECASQNISNIQFILTMRVMQSIIALIYFKEKNIAKLSMKILLNLSYTSDIDECRKLLDLDIMEVVYKLLKNNCFTYQRAYGSMIFNNLMASSHLILDQIISNHKLLDVVFDLMDNDVVDVRRELYQAFKNFLVVCSKQQLLQVIDQGLLDYEIQGLEDCDYSINILSIETLTLILRQFISTEYETNIYEYFQRKNVPRTLEKLQYSQVERIFQLAQNFIREFYDSVFEQ